MQKTATVLLWAALAAFLLPTTTNAQDGQQSIVPPEQRCLAILQPDPENSDLIQAYRDCLKSINEAGGVACTFWTWTGGTIIKRSVKWLAGKEICPDNGLARAEAQVAEYLRQQASKTCSNGKVWVNIGCECPSGTRETSSGNCIPEDSPSTTVQVPTCTGGKVLDSTMQNCVCRTGQFENSQGICYPPCDPGESRNSAGNCEKNNGSPMDRGIPAWCHPGSLDPSCNRDTAPTPKPPQPTGTVGSTPCPTGQTRNAQGNCAWPPCPSGQTRTSQGTCATPYTPPPQPKVYYPPVCYTLNTANGPQTYCI